MSGSAAERARR